MNNIAKTTHPLILVAAGAVTIASLAAAAHFTGLIPARDEAPPAAVAAAPAADMPPPPAAAPAPAPAAPESKPAPRPRTQHRESSAPGGPDRVVRHDRDGQDSGTRRVSTGDAGIDVIPARRTADASMPPPPAARPAAARPPVCNDCGTVESVREVETKGEGSGLGAIAGGVLGGVLGHQVGGGRGKDLATVAGAVGGAFAGHEVEKRVRSEKQYQVTVRFDDGSVRTYTQASATGWQQGERVKLSNGALAPL